LTASVFSSKPLFHFQHVLRIILIHAIILPVGFVVAKWIALSPDFNPIENMWSKIKQILRSLAPRTQDELFQSAKTAFNAISTADCHGFFLHARYAI
jgi:hypothetical protein